MVQVRVQPLYSMASSLAHDSFLQEANTISYVHLLMSRAWRHLDVTHVPLVIQAPLAICWLKKSWFWPPYSVFVLTSGDARGLGLVLSVCAVGLGGNVLIGMLGTWGVVWRTAHVPTVPFTWLRRAKALGPTAHASNHHATRGLPMNAYVLYPLQKSHPLIGRERSREFFDDVFMLMSRVTTFSPSDWLRATFAALWLVTDWISPVYYWSCFDRCIFITRHLYAKCQNHYIQPRQSSN